MKAPKRNWRKYWYCYGLHLVQGIAVGALAWTWPGPAAILLASVILYQHYEYKRLQELQGIGDTIKRDVMDIGIGIHLGLALGGAGQMF